MNIEMLNVELINKLSELNEYEWSDEYKMIRLKQHFSNYYEKLEIDFNDLTIEEAQRLGFKMWENGIMLIPLYLKAKLPIGIELIDIFGNKIINDGTNIDNDIIFGCIAYGIKIEE